MSDQKTAVSQAILIQREQRLGLQFPPKYNHLTRVLEIANKVDLRLFCQNYLNHMGFFLL